MSAPVETLLSRLEQVKPSGERRWMARCPAHDDRSPSLLVSEGEDGRALLNCYAGCENEDIVSALSLKMSDLFDENTRDPNRGIAAEYNYTDEYGTLLYQVLRFEPKGFAQRRKKVGGGWEYSLNGTRRVLFRLPRVLKAAKEHQKIVVVEGEKDALALEALGIVATCNAGGAGKWREEYTESLRGAQRVAVIADRDDAGRSHALDVIRSLRGADLDAVLLEPPEAKDVGAHLENGGSLKELRGAEFPCPSCGRSV